MKYPILLSVLFIFSISCGTESDDPESSDPEIIEDNNGNKYSTVKIGDQTWMAENLNASNFNNGDPIANIEGTTEWRESRDPAWVYYNNNPENGESSGKLYNWFAVNDSRNICPSGWKVPDKQDFEQLVNNFNDIDSAIDMMLLDTGFNASLGGHRQRVRGFRWKNTMEGWWSTTSVDPYSFNKIILELEYHGENGDNTLEFWEDPANNGNYIRCIKS